MHVIFMDQTIGTCLYVCLCVCLVGKEMFFEIK